MVTRCMNKWTCAALIAGICHIPLVSSVWSDNSTEEELARLMSQAVQKQDAEEVERLIEKMRPLDPVTPGMRLIMGNAHFWLGEVEVALAEHGKAAQSGRKRAEAEFEVLVDLMALRRFSDAWSHWEQMPSSMRKTFGGKVLRADLELRFGDPKKGLSVIEKHFADEHSSMETVYASVFGQVGRPFHYQRQLEKRLAAKKEDLSVEIALAESILCPITSGAPDKPRKDAVKEFRSLLGRHPDECRIAGRAAVAQMLAAEVRAMGKVSEADLKDAQAILDIRGGEPGCVEMVEARYLYLDILHHDESTPRMQLLESSVGKFPESRSVRALLLEEYALKGREEEKKEFIEQMTRDFPDDWFPYARRALLEVKENHVAPQALTWVVKGLERSPDSLALNFLNAVLLLQSQRFSDAVRPAATLFAGLLETKDYHHDWQLGMYILASALEKRPAIPPKPSSEQMTWSDVREILTLQSGPLGADHGCFTTGGDRVAIIPLWYRPEVVLSAVRGSAAESASK